MAQDISTKEFVEILQNNSSIWGKEICSIIDTKEDWVVKYFEEKLADILDYFVFMNSEYAEIEYGIDGAPKDVNLKSDGFGLSISECFAIHQYICHRIYFEEFLHIPRLHWVDSVIVLNYIKDRYPLNENKYKLVKYDDKIDYSKLCCYYNYDK